MCRLEYFLVAQSISVDQATNRISLFNVIEEIEKPPDKSVVLQEIYAVSAWNLDAKDFGEEFQVTMIVKPPTKGHQEQRINFIGKSPRHRILQAILGINFSEPGVWEFEVCLNGVHAAKHFVEVREGAAPGNADGATG